MILRVDSLRARLLKLEELVSRLEQLQSGDPAADFRAQWAVERGLQLAAECCFDIGNHILSGHFGAPAEDYEDIFEQLARAGVIPRPLRERLHGLAGFRNVLVHDYLRIDPKVVSDALRRAPADFSAFAEAVASWLGTLPR